MKRATLLIPVLILALAFSAFAQERDVKTGGAGKEETVKLMVNGWANLAWAATSSGLNEAHNAAFAAGNVDANAGIIGSVALRFQASLQDAVDVVVQIATPPTTGAAGFPRHYGGDSTLAGVVVREGYVQWKELIGPEWTIKFGMQNAKFDIRGRGNALFLDTEHAERAFSSGAAPSGGLTVLIPTHNRQELVAGGATFDYKRDKLGIQIGLFPDLADGSADGFGNMRNNEQLWYVSGMYDWDDQGSRFGGILALGRAPGEQGSSVITLGAGVSLKGLGPKGLEVFGEGYFQFGKLTNAVGGGVEKLDAQGFLLNGGVRYELPDNANNAWVEGSILYITGMTDSNDDGALDAGDTKTKQFFSYEGNDDLLVWEDHVVGLDIDQDYWSLRGKGGASFSSGGGTKNNVKIEVKLAYLKMVEGVPVAAGGSDERSAGFEIDANATWVLNKNANLFFGFGFLGSSKVLEETTTDVADKGDSSAYAFKIGTMVNW